MVDTTEHSIHVVVIGGSVRPGNFTGKAAALVVDELSRRENVTVQYLDPAEFDLPLPGQPVTEDVQRLNEAVSGALGVIFATPEYHGSYSSVMKLIIDNLGFPSVLAGKPAALLGIAAGRIGAIKAVEHLRSVLSHVGAIVLPSPVSVAGVQQQFDEDGRCLDAETEKAIRGLADKLLTYIHDHICPKLSLEEMVRQQSKD